VLAAANALVKTGAYCFTSAKVLALLVLKYLLYSRLVLAAAIALVQLGEYEEHRREMNKLAFLRRYSAPAVFFSLFSSTRNTGVR
jgi:hypothetical protein